MYSEHFLGFYNVGGFCVCMCAICTPAAPGGEDGVRSTGTRVVDGALHCRVTSDLAVEFLQ